jgi:hypothetical protein
MRNLKLSPIERGALRRFELLSPAVPDNKELGLYPVLFDPIEVRFIVHKLRRIALKGIQEVERGDWARYHLRDKDFSSIVPEEMEEVVFLAMLRTGDWFRGERGFFLLCDL